MEWARVLVFKEITMEDKFRCLTCYQVLTKEEYEQHKKKGHVTLEYVEYDKEEDE